MDSNTAYLIYLSHCSEPYLDSIHFYLKQSTFQFQLEDVDGSNVSHIKTLCRVVHNSSTITPKHQSRAGVFTTVKFPLSSQLVTLSHNNRRLLEIHACIHNQKNVNDIRSFIQNNNRVLLFFSLFLNTLFPVFTDGYFMRFLIRRRRRQTCNPARRNSRLVYMFV